MWVPEVTHTDTITCQIFRIVRTVRVCVREWFALCACVQRTKLVYSREKVEILAIETRLPTNGHIRRAAQLCAY